VKSQRNDRRAKQAAASKVPQSLLEALREAGQDRMPTQAEVREWRENSRSQGADESERTLDSKSTDRRALVQAYIRQVLEKTGKRITKKDIWSRAGDTSRSEFERWERKDPKNPNRAADERFTRLLTEEKPHLR
jgi:hypothetical protein